MDKEAAGMEKKGWRKKKKNKGRKKLDTIVVDEVVRIRIAKVLGEFRVSDDEVYTFEPGLSKYERAAVHEMCIEMGMTSKSSGTGEGRCVSVFKTKKKKGSTKKEDDGITCLQFSEETKDVLRDLFTRFPPGEGVNEDGLKNSSEKVGKRQSGDDSFCRPSMRKSELSQKVDELNSKISKSKQLKKTMEERARLPIASFKDTITLTLENHQVVLISGETGCGKTTQVPQYILDYMWGKGESCKIVCTQPRRISAISVAERIAYERGETVGDNVGYKIRLESKGGRNSSIMFCTNGILIRLLIGRGSNSLKDKPQSKSKMDCLQGITHIIVDEIHERDRFSDFMLAIIRDLLPSYPHLRMVLMSATIDAVKFSKYFNGCPIIQVPGFTFPVKKLYLEDVLSMLNSADGNHLHHGTADYVKGEASLDDEYKGALDDSINFALTNDEFDPLLQLVSAKQNPIIYNYQHSSTGVSPLMVFAGKGRISDVSMLLSFGADCSLRDRDGRSVLDWAQLSNDIQVYEIVKQQMEKNVSRSTGDELLHKYLASTNTEQIDTVLIERLLKYICNSSSEGAILVFLPGWDDINQTKERLFASSYFQDQSRFMVLSLHSMIPSIEQKKVFKRPPVGARKIILSTNIAETAVTIDDIVYVIDSGRMKVKSYDPYNNVSTLQSSWVSKANARQREGRAGRCQAGICYHLYSKVRAASLPEYQIPEIKRTPIEELCLQIKLLDPSCQIMDFLQKTLDPPVSEAVHNAVTVLKDIGALTHDEGLTDLGQKLGSLPVHPSTSKMLLFAILLNCLDPALTLACAADYREPFLLPMFPNEKKRASIAKVELASLYGGYSDQLAVVAAYDCWRRAKERGQESQFCSQYFISSNTMSMLHGMRKQLQNELAKKGFIPADVSMCSLNAHDPGILRAVLMAGSYPMVGRFLPQRKNTKGTCVETANGTKVRLHAHSSNFGLCSRSSGGGPLIVYDEITRGDSGMYIRNCSVINPYPLLLIASEMVVAPANDDSENDEDEYSLSLEEDEMETNVSSGQHAEEIMSSPDNFVSVVVDRWLNFKATALDVAQIYCLRERLYSAILFKVKYPDAVLPPALGASMYAIACSLSFDVLPSMVTSGEIVEQQMSTVNPIGSNESQSKGKKAMGYCPASTFLQSLFFGNGHSPSNSKMKASSNCSASLPYSKSSSLGNKSNLQKSQASGDVGSVVRSSKRRR